MNESTFPLANTTRRPAWAPFVRLLLAALLLSALALSLPASARPRHGGGPGGPRLGELLESHAEELGLAPETRDAIREIVESSHEEGEILRDDVAEARRELHELLGEDPVDRDRVFEQVERIGELRTESQKHRIETMLEIRALLTPEQRAALTEQRRSFGDHIESLHDACGAELSEQCPERGPRGFHCLQRNRETLSEGCREALDAMPAPPHHGRMGHHGRGGHGKHGKHAGCPHAAKGGCPHMATGGCPHMGKGGCSHGEGQVCSGAEGAPCGHAGCPRHAAPAEPGPSDASE